MEKRFEKYKGIHPGIVLERELKRRSLRQRPFALSVAEHPQTFNAITKGRRSMGTALALKIERVLGLEEGTLALLQTHYDILKEKEKQQGETPDLSILRQALFWDTDINRIDWHRQYNAVIQRVFERGNAQEKNEITCFYGSSKVQMTLKASRTMPMTLRQKP